MSVFPPVMSVCSRARVGLPALPRSSGAARAPFSPCRTTIRPDSHIIARNVPIVGRLKVPRPPQRMRAACRGLGAGNGVRARLCIGSGIFFAFNWCFCIMGLICGETAVTLWLASAVIRLFGSIFGTFDHLRLFAGLYAKSRGSISGGAVCPGRWPAGSAAMEDKSVGKF